MYNSYCNYKSYTTYNAILYSLAALMRVKQLQSRNKSDLLYTELSAAVTSTYKNKWIRTPG